MNLLKTLPDEIREPQVNGWGVTGDPYMEAMEDALWADPGESPGSILNTRGVSHCWGPDFTERFLKATGLKLILRSHQVPKDMSGVFVHKAHSDGRVLTIFST